MEGSVPMGRISRRLILRGAKDDIGRPMRAFPPWMDCKAACLHIVGQNGRMGNMLL
jgi:hypothetical protein